MCIGVEDVALEVAGWKGCGVGVEGVWEVEGSAVEWDIGEVVVIVTNKAGIVDGIREVVKEETAL